MSEAPTPAVKSKQSAIIRPYMVAQRVVYGIQEHVKPLREFPEGKVRIRIRAEQHAIAHVWTKEGIRAFRLEDCEDFWRPLDEVARSITCVQDAETAGVLPRLEPCPVDSSATNKAALESVRIKEALEQLGNDIHSPETLGQRLIRWTNPVPDWALEFTLTIFLLVFAMSLLVVFQLWLEN